MKRNTLSRRMILRGAALGAAVTLPLPLLDQMLNNNGTALADGTSLPPRFGVWFYGNGVELDRWVPSATGPGYPLSPELESMVNVREDITVLSGLTCPIDGQVHHSGQGGMLTGDTIDLMDNDASVFLRKSIDVLVSEQWAGAAKFPLINTAIYRDPRYAIGTPGHISFNGTGFNPKEVSPGALYDRFFGIGFPSPPTVEPPSTPTRDPHALARSLAIDAVLEDEKRLTSRLGMSDRARMEQHMDGLRDLQTRITALDEGGPSPELGLGCSPVDRPTFEAEANDDTRIGEKNRVMSDLIALAYACDLTRVATVMHHTWYSPAFREIGVEAQQHGLTHDEGGSQDTVHRTVSFVMSNLAYFFEALKALPEGDGTLLDNCAIYACTESRMGRLIPKTICPSLSVEAPVATWCKGVISTYPGSALCVWSCHSSGPYGQTCRALELSAKQITSTNYSRMPSGRRQSTVSAQSTESAEPQPAESTSFRAGS